jgi:hypothetical protein
MTYTFVPGGDDARYGDIDVSALRADETPHEVWLSDSVRSFLAGERLLSLELDDISEFDSADAAVAWARDALGARSTA